MVLRKGVCAKYQRLCLNEGVHELVGLAKACSPVPEENVIRVLDDDSIDDAYRVVLLGLLACQEDYEDEIVVDEHFRTFKARQEDDLIECKKRLVSHKKRKEIIDVSYDAELQCDPQYAQFLRHLKTHDKSYVLEFEEDDGSLVGKYEGVIESDKEGDLEKAPMSKMERNRTLNVVHEKIPDEPEGRMLTRGCKRKRGPSDQDCGVESQHKLGEMGNTDRMESVGGQRNAKHGVNCSFGMHKGHTVVNEKINHQRQENGKNLPRALKPKSGFSNQMPGRENQRCVSNKKTMSPAHKKSKYEAEREKNQHKPDNLHSKIGNTNKVERIGGPRKRQTRGNLRGPIKPRNGIPSQIPRVENQEYTSRKKGRSPTHEISRNETKRDNRNVRLENDPHVCINKNQAGKINHQKQGNGGNSPRAVKPKTENPDQMSAVEKTKSPTHGKSRNETNREVNHVHMHNGHRMGFGNISELNGQKKQPGRNLHGKRKQKAEVPNEMHRTKSPRSAVKPKTEILDQMSAVEKTKSPTHGKSRNETNREVNHVHMHDGHRMEFGNISEINGQKKQPGRNLHGKRKQKAELPNEMHRMKNCRGDYSQHALAKNPKSLNPKRLMNEAKNVKTGMCSCKEHRRVEAEKYESDSEVEILDEAACFRKEIANPFVPAKILVESMEEDGIMHLGGSSLTDVFRKEVLDFLKKPYDAEEYTRLRQAVQDGGYLKHYPEIAGKLKLEKYRYNRRRRLALFRGLFFWLQNLSREGSFKPWKDGACLAAEPPYKRRGA